MQWNDSNKFQQKKKDKPKIEQFESKKYSDVKTYTVVLQEDEKVVIVLQKGDVIKIVQDKEGNIYPEQFRELINKGILKEKVV